MRQQIVEARRDEKVTGVTEKRELFGKAKRLEKVTGV